MTAKDQPGLKVVPTTVEDAWIRRLVELLDGDQWKLADAILDRYPLADYPPKDDSGRNGLREALQRDADKLRREHGIVAKAGRLQAVRSTAIAWVPSCRQLGTSFEVHRRMRGADRASEMAKRVRQAEREGWPLSSPMLSRFRAEENRKPPRPYDERMRRAVARAIRREMLGGIITERLDWWMATTIVEAERDVAVRELRALANAIAAGPLVP